MAVGGGRTVAAITVAIIDVVIMIITIIIVIYYLCEAGQTRRSRHSADLWEASTVWNLPVICIASTHVRFRFVYCFLIYDNPFPICIASSHVRSFEFL